MVILLYGKPYSLTNRRLIMTTNVTTPPLPALKAQAEVESAGGILDHVAISDLLTPPDNDHIYGQIRLDGLL